MIFVPSSLQHNEWFRLDGINLNPSCEITARRRTGDIRGKRGSVQGGHNDSYSICLVYTFLQWQLEKKSIFIVLLDCIFKCSGEEDVLAYLPDWRLREIQSVGFFFSFSFFVLFDFPIGGSVSCCDRRALGAGRVLLPFKVWVSCLEKEQAQAADRVYRKLVGWHFPAFPHNSAAREATEVWALVE